MPTTFDRIFYDGRCGLCHRGVMFALRHDAEGRLFRFAPLEGRAFESAVAAKVRATLPVSLIVLTADGRVLARSAGTLHILRRIGGLWGVLGAMCRVVPGGLRDWVYDRVASLRRRLYPAPADACPVMTPQLRSRFDL